MFVWKGANAWSNSDADPKKKQTLVRQKNFGLGSAEVNFGTVWTYMWTLSRKRTTVEGIVGKYN